MFGLGLDFRLNSVGRRPELQAYLLESTVHSSDEGKFVKAAECLLPYNCERTGVVVDMVRHLLPKLDRNSLRLSNRAFSRFVPALLLGFASLSCAGQQSALDLDGKSVDPLKVKTGRLVVLVFVREDCPISGRYAPMIQRISDEHQKDARFYLVFPDKSESPADVRRYLHEFRYSIPGLRDPDHALVKQADAKSPPRQRCSTPRAPWCITAASTISTKRSDARVPHRRRTNWRTRFGRS